MSDAKKQQLQTRIAIEAQANRSTVTEAGSAFTIAGFKVVHLVAGVLVFGVALLVLRRLA